MSRSGRPPLAGGSAVAAGKNISKLSRHALSSRRAVDRAKLLLIWPATGLVFPLLLLLLHRRPQRRLCRRLGPRGMPCAVQRNLLTKRWQSIVPPMELSVIHRLNQHPLCRGMSRRVMTAPPVGTNAWSISAAREMLLYRPWPHSNHLLWKSSSNLLTTLV
jgi:hypothetical protein